MIYHREQDLVDELDYLYRDNCNISLDQDYYLIVEAKENPDKKMVLPLFSGVYSLNVYSKLLEYFCSMEQNNVLDISNFNKSIDKLLYIIEEINIDEKCLELRDNKIKEIGKYHITNSFETITPDNILIIEDLLSKYREILVFLRKFIQEYDIQFRKICYYSSSHIEVNLDIGYDTKIIFNWNTKKIHKVQVCCLFRETHDLDITNENIAYIYARIRDINSLLSYVQVAEFVMWLRKKDTSKLSINEINSLINKFKTT
jgi:hypothetical protein